MREILRIGALGAMLVIGGSALAQAFPTKPIRFIAAFPAGGPSDIVARAMAKRMSEVLGQPVIVDNVDMGAVAGR